MKSKPQREREASPLQPIPSPNKIPSRKRLRLRRAREHPKAPPRDPIRGPGPGPGVLILGVEERSEGKIAIPHIPPGRINYVAYVTLHHDGPGIFLPGPAEVGREAGQDGEEVGGGANAALLDDDPRVLIGVVAALGGDHVALAGVGAAGVDVAVLEDDGCVAEDEVDGAGDEAARVELAEGVDVEGVLVGQHVAAVEGAEVRVHAEGHRLVLRRARRVLERDVTGQEPPAHHRCMHAELILVISMGKKHSRPFRRKKYDAKFRCEIEHKRHQAM